jgi:hypothetical protein
VENKIQINITSNWYAEIEGDHLKFTYYDSTFKVRKSQLGKDLIVGYRSFPPYNCYLLEKSLDKNTYTIKKIFYDENKLVTKFVDEKIDFYCLEEKFFNENNEEVDIMDINYLWVFVRATNVYPIRDNIYLLYGNKEFLTIFDYKPKVAFLVDESIQKWFRNAGANTYIFRDILLRFRMNKHFVKSLANLETIEEMSKSLKDYLLMSIV